MTTVIYGPAPVVVLATVTVLFALPLSCIIDAASRSSADFVQTDSNKTLWIVLPFFFGILAAIVYLAAIRPKLKAVGK